MLDLQIKFQVVKGELSVYLECTSDGNPYPVFTWWRRKEGDDVEVTSEMDTRYTLSGGRFTIEDPKDKDIAYYRCKATNDYGTVLSHFSQIQFGCMYNIYSTKKLRKSQKTIQHKNTKTNNYSISIYLFRCMSSVEENVFSSLLALIPLLRQNFAPKNVYRFPHKHLLKCKLLKLKCNSFACHIVLT